MASREIKTRVINKHDTEANWLKATTFIPKQGEIIVYDIDTTHTYERFKIGDGKTFVNSLPFATSGEAEKLKIGRTISLTGDVTGLAVFDGSENVSITTTITDNSHTHAASVITGLAKVATSGNYEDLTNKPTLGALASKDAIGLVYDEENESLSIEYGVHLAPGEEEAVPVTEVRVNQLINEAINGALEGEY